MVISQGEVWWANLAEPVGSAPGFRRPVVIVQSDSFNRSKISTVVCVPLTSNLHWADAPGNVLLTSAVTGLGSLIPAPLSSSQHRDHATARPPFSGAATPRYGRARDVMGASRFGRSGR